MGKAEERCRVDRIVVCEESLIWFEGMPVVVWLVWLDGCGLIFILTNFVVWNMIIVVFLYTFLEILVPVENV